MSKLTTILNFLRSRNLVLPPDTTAKNLLPRLTTAVNTGVRLSMMGKVRLSHASVWLANWVHDPGPRSKNRWRDEDTGRLFYGVKPPGSGGRTKTKGPTRKQQKSSQKVELMQHVERAKEILGRVSQGENVSAEDLVHYASYADKLTNAELKGALKAMQAKGYSKMAKAALQSEVLRNYKPKPQPQKPVENPKKENSAQEKPEKEDSQQTITQMSPKDFAVSARKAAEAVPKDKWFGDSRVFIADAYDQFKKTTGGTLSEFKKAIFDAYKEGLIETGRADIIQEFNPKLVADSEVKGPGGYYTAHFIKVPEPTKQKEKSKQGKPTSLSNDAISSAVSKFQDIAKNIGDYSYDELKSAVDEMKSLSKADLAKAVEQIGYRPERSKKGNLDLLKGNLVRMRRSKSQTDVIDDMFDKSLPDPQKGQ